MRPLPPPLDRSQAPLSVQAGSSDNAPSRPANPARTRWAMLLARIYGVLPLLCPGCGGEMKILAFLTDPPVVSGILLHLNLHHLPPPGQGVEWLSLFEKREDKFTQHYGERFDKAHAAGLLAGAYNFCAAVRFKTADSAERLGVPLYGDEGQHGSLLGLIEDGYQIVSF